MTPWDAVVYNGGARDNQADPRRWTWPDLCKVLTTRRDWPHAKVDVPAWSPVRMSAPRRLAANVAAVTMLVLDCDRGESLDTLEALGSEYVRIGHTSWSHRPAHSKVRLVFPFASPCPVEHWPRVWDAAAQWAAAQGVTIDAATKDPSRLYFLPATEPTIEAREWWEFWWHGTDEGCRLLSWAALANDYPPVAPPPIVHVATCGRLEDTEDAREKRRRAFARAMVEHRCRGMVAAGEGGKGAGTGRANRTFALGRLVRRLALAGVLDEADGVAMVEAAAVEAGLAPKEYGRAIRNGLARGSADGPEDIEQYLEER